MQQLLHLLPGDARHLGQSLLLRLLAVFLDVGCLGGHELAHPLGGMDRHPDETRVIHEAPGNALANPFGGVGGKTVIQCIVKLPDRHDEADVALLDQIHERHAPAAVFPGHRHHQPQIGGDHFPDGLLIPGGAPGGQLSLLVLGQTGIAADLLQIVAQLLIRRPIGFLFLYFCCHSCPF